MADRIGLTPDEVERIRAKIDPDDWARAAMQSVLGSLFAGERERAGA